MDMAHEPSRSGGYPHDVMKYLEEPLRQQRCTRYVDRKKPRQKHEIKYKNSSVRNGSCSTKREQQHENKKELTDQRGSSIFWKSHCGNNDAQETTMKEKNRITAP